MTKTSKNWEDSGFDCDHCGGKILKRIEHKPGQPDSIIYQCATCGCQWSADGDVIQIGSGTYCRVAQRRRLQQQEEPEPPSMLLEVNRWAGVLSKSLWILIAVIAAVILLRFGGGVVLRLVLPVAVIIVGAYFLVRYGRTQSWW